MNPAGKSALVTGGASGLGKAAALRLHELGSAVAVMDLASSDGEETAHQIGDRAMFVAADVARADEVSSAVERVVDRFGGVHVVVNCAGIATPGRVVSRDGVPLDLEGFEKVVRVNLIGTFNVIRLAAGQMCRQEPDGEERGVIVNTASIAAFEGQVGQSAYAASKAGIAGLTLPLARDLADRQIRCVAVAPGIFDTPMLAGVAEDLRVELARNVPHPHRLGAPEEFASLVAHVVANPMLNGEVIRLDGALRMPPR